jgi:hypothetical protein
VVYFIMASFRHCKKTMGGFIVSLLDSSNLGVIKGFHCSPF